MHRISLKCAALLAVLLCLSTARAYAEDPAVVQAKKLFDQYVAYEKAYDERFKDLFDDDAVIKSVKVDQNNVGSPMPEIGGRQLKESITALFPFLQDRGLSKKYGACKYTDVKFARVTDKVKVDAWRYEPSEQFTGRFSLLIGKAYDGKWKIVEMFTEFRPPPSDTRYRSWPSSGSRGRSRPSYYR